MEFSHKSVLLEETIEALRIRPDGIYLDCTLGGGGHAYEIAKRLTDGGRLIGIDRDEEAIEAASGRLSVFGDRVTIVKTDYASFERVLADLSVEALDGIVMDLGVSSHQFDDPDRGFSYREDAPLDMRMDRDSALTAREIVNTYSESDLFRIIRDFGEDPFAKNIAKHIAMRRAEKDIETTFELVDIIKAAVPAKMREKGGHPAKRTFQALRIEVNSELSELSQALPKMIDRLTAGGRIAVISFHSLEDRIVKNTFREAADPCTCPKNFPVCVCGKKPKGRLVTRKPVSADSRELEENPRSKSAHLRTFEHI